MTILGLFIPGLLILAFAFVKTSVLYAITLVTTSMGLLAFNSAGHLINHVDVAPSSSAVTFAISNTIATVPGILVGPLSAHLVTSRQYNWMPVFVIASLVDIIGALFFLTFSQSRVVVVPTNDLCLFCCFTATLFRFRLESSMPSSPHPNNVEETDFYKILEITRSANGDDIKKAYRKLALSMKMNKNPDNKHIAEVKFKQITAAYEVLSDPSKRRIYDQYGLDGLRASSNGGTGSSDHTTNRFSARRHADIFDIFDEFMSRNPFQLFEEMFGELGQRSGGNGGGLFNFDDFMDPSPRGFFNFGRQQLNPINILMNPLGSMPGFGMFNSLLFDAAEPQRAQTNGGFATSISSYMSGGKGGPEMRQGVQKTTRIVNGHRVTTTKIFDNGEVTEITEQDGQKVSEKRNGRSILNGTNQSSSRPTSHVSVVNGRNGGGGGRHQTSSRNNPYSRRGESRWTSSTDNVVPKRRRK
ncbi:hypothetical protein ACOME3_005142 [Neoechinorhynchus agilis]